ncbi:TonB-dependent receptor [Fulvimonas sp. R45]|uniref:TonB-dependent receptor n=1 Tax=Fulvimonas sp. R45 TaxID=3045937 RepID=UPI00265ED67D|nr:TonB-dependent receptor [Fulvimonas sp. R45]MDO1529831.1 TonB-dependent receptor [Fulvimonas sp. R45]
MRPNTVSSAIRTALLGSLLLAGAVPAFAQDSGTTRQGTPATQADQTKAKDLNTVVVTARSGVETRTKAETSYSITTIDEDRLRMQAPTSVTEAMKSVPGFWVEASGGEASGNIRARGIPVDGFGSVTLLEDGMPVQHDPALGYLNADQAFRLDETIERIEVVRGGPSSVFYSNAPAGAINFIPRRVGDTPEGLFKYTTGNYGLNRADFWYGTPVGDGWKFGVGGFYRKDNGIRNPGFDANKGGQIRMNIAKDFEHGSFSADVKHMDDDVALYLGIPMRTTANGDIRAVPGFNGNFGTLAGPETEHAMMKEANGGLYDFDNSKGTHVKRDQLTLKFNHDLGADWKLAESMRYSDTKTQRNGMFPNALSSADKFLTSASNLKAWAPYLPAGTTGLELRYVDNPAQVFDNKGQNGNGLVVIGGLRGVTMPLQEFDNDLRLLRKFDIGGQSHDVTIGYYRAHFNQGFSRYSSTVLLDARDRARLLDLVAVGANGQPLGTLTDNGFYSYGYEWENANGSSTTNALYLSDEWQVTDALRIDGGVRWEHVNTKGWVELKQNVNLGTFPTSSMKTGTGQTVSYDHGFHKLGWTLGVNYQFSDRTGVFARWTPTYRLPNLSTYITNATATPLIQTMKLGEVGYKFSNRWLDLYATAFYTKYDDVGFSNYVFDPNNNTSVAQTGYASTKTKGLELETTWFPTDWFDVQLTATYQDPKYEGLRYTDKDASGGPVLRNYTGNQLIRVPKMSYRVVPGLNLLDGRLRLQLAYEHEGQRYVDTANSVKLPAYDVLSASARYDVLTNLSLFLYADNMTNSLGLTEGNPRAGELASSDVGANTFIARPILGRAYRAAVMYRF